MKNFVQPGEFMPVVAAGTVSAGSVWEGTDRIGVYAENATAGQTVSVLMQGVVWLTKITGTAFTAGQQLYWDPTPGELTTAAAATNIPAGYAFGAAAAGATRAQVALNAGGGETA